MHCPKVGDLGLGWLDSLAKLRTLALHENKAAGIGFKAWDSASNLRELLVHGGLSDAGLEAIARIDGLTRATLLQTDATLDGVQALAGLPRLHMLRIAGLEDAHAEALDAFAGKDTLRQAVAIDVALAYADLELLDRMAIPTPVEAAEDLKSVEDATVQDWVRLGRLNGLRRLVVKNNRATGEAVDMSRSRTLRELGSMAG